MRAPRYSLLLTIGCVVSAPALAQAPFSFETTPGRLPKNVVPTDYTIEIIPNIETLSIEGKESIALEFRSATDTIVFNTLNETLTEVRLDGSPVRSVASDVEQQWTSLKLARSVPVGKHTLTFSYHGKIQSQPQGLFLQHYTRPSGEKAVLLSTQMEPADARRMFPCWDEPAFRATFQLSVTVPSVWRAVANTPVNKQVTRGMLTTTTFERSPQMPSYLVEYSAGELAAITATAGPVKLAVWAVRGQEHYGKEALANAQVILADYNEYFGYPYPLPKLDLIAIPGGLDGAMENWGAITYNNRRLLVLPTSTLGDRQTVFMTEAHEMAHQWNGDLVTMSWWNDLWLNESFASWMTAKEIDRRHPDWRWREEEDTGKELAMSADARAGSNAIQRHVTNELQADSAFDSITYEKGEAILGMFEAYIGEDTFRSGVRSYIKARAFSSANTTDLWNALNLASGKNIGELATEWITKPGFPLVSAKASCDSAGQRTVRLTQSRFRWEGGTDANSPQWSIPLRVRVGANAKPESVLFVHNGQKLPAGRCDEPLSLSADAIGFYRVHYDPVTLEVNTQSFPHLPAGDRIALLDDEWALVGTGKEKLGSYLALARSMARGGDLNVRAWAQIEQALGTIEYDERGSAGHDAFAAYARSLIRPAFDRLGWDPKPGETAAEPKLRRALLEDLGLWGDPAIIAEARKRFDAFLKDHSKLSPEDQTPILDIVAATADAPTFEKLHALAKGAKDGAELARYYSALMYVGDESLAAHAAQIALSDEIPPQADNQRLRLIGTLARLHQQLAWTTFSTHSDTFLASQAPFVLDTIAQDVPRMFWSGIPLNQFNTWIRARVPAQMADDVSSGMENARFKLDEKQRLVPAADLYIQTSAARN